VLSGSDDENAAVEAVRKGAQDYLIKDGMDDRKLGRALRYAVERQRTEARLTYLALHDPVTGQWNRVAFRDEVLRAMQAADDGVAVVYVDLDRFQTLNDTFGHDAGDQLLREVGDRLCRAVRTSDLVARFGGDEFGVLLRGVRDDAHLEAIGLRIIDGFLAPVWLDGHEVVVTASVGVARYPECGATVDEVVIAADRAMYEAKAAGRNMVLLARGRPEPVPAGQLHLEEQLRHALSRDELVLYYQPEVDAASGAVVAFEALLRWHHPTLGLLPPSRFIPLLEDTGLIRPVGSWVIRTAVEWIAAYRARFHSDARVSVNVSPSQLNDDSVRLEVRDALARWALPPSALELEFTEACMTRDEDATSRVLAGLRDLGVRIALDDFGTGFSSLSHLRRFQVDTLKIDQSFLANAEDRLLVSGIIGLGRRLGLTVVAEGVEADEQRDFLVAEGCHVLQGFLFGRPTPGPDLLAAPVP